MGLKEAIDNLKFDARMIDINLKAQTLSAADYKKQLEKLPDLSSNCVTVELESEDKDSFNGQDHN